MIFRRLHPHKKEQNSWERLPGSNVIYKVDWDSGFSRLFSTSLTNCICASIYLAEVDKPFNVLLHFKLSLFVEKKEAGKKLFKIVLTQIFTVNLINQKFTVEKNTSFFIFVI